MPSSFADQSGAKSGRSRTAHRVAAASQTTSRANRILMDATMAAARSDAVPSPTQFYAALGPFCRILLRYTLRATECSGWRRAKKAIPVKGFYVSTIGRSAAVQRTSEPFASPELAAVARRSREAFAERAVKRLRKLRQVRDDAIHAVLGWRVHIGDRVQTSPLRAFVGAEALRVADEESLLWCKPVARFEHASARRFAPSQPREPQHSDI